MADKKKPNRLAILGGLLVLLLALIAFAADPLGWFKPSEAEVESQQGMNKLLCDFTTQAVTAFEIKPSGGEAFKLALDTAKNRWYIELDAKRYQADMDRVSKLLDQVPQLRADSEATNKKDKYATYEVDDAAGIGLKVFTTGDKPAADLIVGKADNSYKGCYVRAGEDPVVYRAAANLKSLIAFSAADFRTHKPWQFEPATATKVVVRPPAGAAVEFTKQGEFWQYGAGMNANQNLLKETVKKLSEATVNDYVDAPDPAAAKLAPAPAIEVTTNLGVYKLSLGAVEDSTLYVQDQDGWVYKASEYSMKFISELAYGQLTTDDTQQAEAQDGKAEGKPAAGAAPKSGAAPPAAPGKPVVPGK